jgi:hypothetical protein
MSVSIFRYSDSDVEAVVEGVSESELYRMAARFIWPPVKIPCMV